MNLKKQQLVTFEPAKENSFHNKLIYQIIIIS